MPLPQVTVQRLQITDFQGIDVERGKLVRAENSWQLLENFDLVKPGVIRKIRGNKKLTLEPITIGDWVLAFRDYQKVPGGTELLVVISAQGKLYISGMLADPILLNLIGDLYSPTSLLDEAPYVVSLPFMENGQKVQYIAVTVGDKDFPKKYDGLISITRLGIDNPGDLFTVPYQHSVAIPQSLYTDATAGDIYYYTTPDAAQGIPVTVGRQYRAAWYNPITGHRSSLFPLHLGEYPIGLIITTPNQLTKPLGTLQTVPAAPFVMAVPIFLDNLPQRVPFAAVNEPETGYTKLQFFATRDGNSEFYLLPRVYDRFGRVVSDENGAVDLDGLNYGFNTLNDPDQIGQTGETALYDGFIPLVDSILGIPFWYNPVIYSDNPQYTVNGAAQTGNILNVTKTSGPTIARGQFRLKGDDTIYVITNHIGATQWTVDPPIVNAPASGSSIEILFTKPVPDQSLITPWLDSTESPFDRINDPPPKSSWGAVYQNRLFLLDAADKTRLTYSRIGDYESFPPNNVFRFTQADFDPITAIIGGRQVGLVSQGADQRLIVAKQQSTYQITGSSILDFALTGLFPETGIVHKRGITTIGGFTVGITRQGIEVLQGQMPSFIGTKIKDIVDQVKLDEYGPMFSIERTNYQILMGVNLSVDFPSPIPNIDKIILMREPRTGGEGFLSGFSIHAALPTILAVVQESGFGKNTRILAGGLDGNIYQLFTGGDQVVDSPVVGVAQTQKLPQLDRESRKLFRRVRFDGNEIGDDEGWKIQYIVDGISTDLLQMYDENLIGLVGKEIEIVIKHVRSVPDDEDPPQLSNMMLEYSVIGESRGGNN